MSASDRLKWILEVDNKSAVKGFNEIGAAADKELGKADTKLDKLGGSMTKFGAGAMAFAGLAGAGLVKLGGDAAAYAVEMGKAADGTGLTVEQFSRLNEAAGDLNIGTSAVEKTLGFMNKTLGTSPEKFAAMGVEIVKAKDGTTDVNETFLRLVDRLNQIEDPQKRAAEGAKLLGRGWQEMGELVEGGSDRLRASLAAVSDQKVISPEELAKARDFRAAMDQMKDAGQDLALALGQGVAPMMATVAKGVGGLVDLFGKLDAVTSGAAGQLLGIGTVALGAAGALSFITGKVITARDRFSELGKMFGRTGDAATTAAGKMATAEVATTTSGAAADVAATKVSRLGAAWKAVTPFAIGAALAAQAYNTATDVRQRLDAQEIYDLRDALEAAGFKWKDLWQAATEGKELPPLIDELGNQFFIFDGVLVKLTATTKQQTAETDKQVSATQREAEARRDASEAQKDAELAMKRVNAQYDEMGGATAAQTAANERHYASLGALNAQWDGYAAKVDDAKTATQDFGTTYDEVTGKWEDRSNWLNVLDAIDQYNVKTKSGTLSFREQEQANLDLQKTLAEYVRGLENIPEDQKTTIIAQIDRGEFARVESLLAFLSRERVVNISGNVVSANIRNAMEGRGGNAAGGIQGAHELRPVNEVGPEVLTVAGKKYLMTGDQAGVVTPNHALGRPSGVPAFPSHITVQIGDESVQGIIRRNDRADTLRFLAGSRP